MHGVGMATRLPDLISTDELAKRLGDKHLVILDCSWHMPNSGRHALREYTASHIEGARFYDIDAVSAKNDLPHMLPEAEAFANTLGALGINKDHELVLYDTYGFFSVGRAWWMFKIFCHEKVRILDGGFPRWQKEGHPTDAGQPSLAPSTYQAEFQRDLLAEKQDVLNALHHPEVAIIDARSPSRFHGQEREPRLMQRCGHIPGSMNLHYRELVDDRTRLLKSKEELQQLFEERGVYPDQEVITTCGSGVTAAALAFVLNGLGYKDWSVYDGSWAEWGAYNADDPNPTPVEHDLTEMTGIYMPPMVTVEATFTALDMNHPWGKPAPNPPIGQLALLQAQDITPEFYRYLHYMVGRPWHWTDRLLLDDEALSDLLNEPMRDIFVLYSGGVPLGFFEINAKHVDEVKIPYVGIHPEHIGRGLGRFMVESAVAYAWRKAPQHVTLYTTSLDHPRALQLLQKVGFSVISQTTDATLKFIT